MDSHTPSKTILLQNPAIIGKMNVLKSYHQYGVCKVLCHILLIVLVKIDARGIKLASNRSYIKTDVKLLSVRYSQMHISVNTIAAAVDIARPLLSTRSQCSGSIHLLPTI